jgi:hypothetical protein
MSRYLVVGLVVTIFSCTFLLMPAKTSSFGVGLAGSRTAQATIVFSQSSPADAPPIHPGTQPTHDVPEPSTALQIGIGLLLGVGLIALWRKQRVSSTGS